MRILSLLSLGCILVPVTNTVIRAMHDDVFVAYQNSKLLGAAYEGELSEVQHALQAGAVVTAQDTDKETPLFRAALKGHKAIVQLMLIHQAQVNSRTRFGRTPLHAATEGGHTEIVKLLLEDGAQCDVQDNWCVTPLYLAVFKSYTAIIKLLLEHKANITLKTITGETALDLARRINNQEILQLLEMTQIVAEFENI